MLSLHRNIVRRLGHWLLLLLFWSSLLGFRNLLFIRSVDQLLCSSIAFIITGTVKSCFLFFYFGVVLFFCFFVVVFNFGAVILLFFN